MDPSTVRKEQLPQGPPAGAAGRTGSDPLQDWCDVGRRLQMKLREKEESKAKTEERKQVLAGLQQRVDELHKEIKLQRAASSGCDKVLMEAQRLREERLQKEAELKRLKEEYAARLERKQEVERQVQRHAVYRDFMERVLKLTKYKDEQQLMDHFKSLLHLREQLSQKESKAQEQIDQHERALLTLQKQHHLLPMHKNIQLSQLNTVLQKARSEELIWGYKWNRIQATASGTAVELEQIKMATYNLYEIALEGQEPLKMHETEKQLDKVKMFIQDHVAIVRRHQTSHKATKKRYGQTY